MRSGIRLQRAATFRVLDQGDAQSIFHTAARVVRLELAGDPRLEPERFPDPPELDQRRLSDQRRDVRVNHIA
jgi:hypothetical protein